MMMLEETQKSSADYMVSFDFFFVVIVAAVCSYASYIYIYFMYANHKGDS